MQALKRMIAICLNILIPLVGIVLFIIFAPRILMFFIPFVIGFIISLIANPLVRLLEKHINIARKHSSVIIVVVVLCIILALVYGLMVSLFMLIQKGIMIFPQFISGAMVELNALNDSLTEVLSALPNQGGSTLLGILDNVSEYVKSFLGNIASPTVTYAGVVIQSVPNALVYTIVTILSSYFFIAGRESLIEIWKKYCPHSIKRYGELAREDMKKLISGYFLAQFQIMVAIIIVLTIGLLILGSKYAILSAILIGILDFLPIFGAGIILLPWAVAKLLNAQYVFALGLLILYIATQIAKQVITPKIIGDNFGLPPLATLFVLFIGFKVSGIGGMVLAVPVAIIVIKLYEYGLFDGVKKGIRDFVEEVRKFREKYDT